MNKPKPVYLLAGGQRENPGGMLSLFSKIFKAYGVAHPTVAYIGAASGDNWMFFKLIAGLLKAAGAREVIRVILAGKQADAAGARGQISAAEVIFISGGDVEAGMRWLQHHALIPFLKKLYAGGKPFFGVSAGSIMLGKQWVRWEDPKDDATAELFDCLGIAPLVCDTHAENENWEELQAAVKLMPGSRQGFGIPTGGVLRVSAAARPAAGEKACAVYANRNGKAVRLADLPARDF